MENLDSTKIKLTGEKEVAKWLNENDYSNFSKELLHSNEYAIRASGKTEDILIQVRTFSHPNRPFKLSEFEADLLTRRAVKLKSVAYVAYVVVDKAGNLVEGINWERLG